ncbi:MAG TPA: Type 1 glutamine amidotransferase-like domain-containing protein [Acidimicrobiales bacterium]|jgi:cyanophycinase|nr:Type 1 glutamine amidotransferase-like domain-containing protein [Acidimicrobiales bacterium]
MSGPLALVGGGEWRDGCDFDGELLEASGGNEVLVLPTAAAYEHPDHVVERATRWFEAAGATVRPVMAVDRRGAQDEANAAAVRAARFVYLSDGSPMHLRSVLMQSPLWDAIAAAWHGGAVLAASGAGAMVLCDPAVDPRGGAFTLGLGLLPHLAVVARADTWSEDKLHRTLQLTPAGVPLVEVDERTALLRVAGGPWRAVGVGGVSVWIDGHQADVTALPA